MELHAGIFVVVVDTVVDTVVHSSVTSYSPNNYEDMRGIVQ